MRDRRTRRGFHLRRLQVTLSAANWVRELELYLKRLVRAESASALIDEKINELGDCRGKTLAKVREIILIWARRSPAEPDQRRSPPPCDEPFPVQVVGLPGLAPSQVPQFACREDEGEHTSHAERVKRPDEQEGWAGLGDCAAKNASRSHHVDDRHAQRKERPDLFVAEFGSAG